MSQCNIWDAFLPLDEKNADVAIFKAALEQSIIK